MPEENGKDSLNRFPVTKEELELLATPDADLRKRAEVFSFDEGQFKARMEGGDKWAKLLQAHLYFDHVITKMLIEALLNPEAVKVSRMSFTQKLQFILALGLLPNELVSTIDFINGLRNKIAHDLNFEISDKDERDLSNCTPKRLRDVVLADQVRAEGPIRFDEVLEIVLYQIEVFRQRKVADRLLGRKMNVRLRTVLERTENAVYRE